MRPKIIYIAYRFPLLTQTFIQREIAGVASQGIDIEILSLRHTPFPEGFKPAPGTTITYFQWYELLWLPLRMLVEFLRDPSLLAEGWNILLDLRFPSRDNFLINLLGTIVAFSRASHYRNHLPDHFHGTWATGPATAAALLARMTGKTFSFGGHAFDIYRFGGDALLTLKLTAAAFVHTTTEANVSYLRRRMGSISTPVVLSRRGLPSMPEKTRRALFQQKIQILAVARLVEKKGLQYQIQAAAELKSQNVSFHWTIIGEGPLQSALDTEIKRLQLGDCVTLTGALPHHQVEHHYENSDIFIHSGFVDSEGDRDGLPNVLPEAMARGLAVISSPTPGANEAIIDGQTGWIANPKKNGEIASTIRAITTQQQEALQRADAARQWVEENFLAKKNTAILGDAFLQVIANCNSNARPFLVVGSTS